MAQQDPQQPSERPNPTPGTEPELKPSPPPRRQHILDTFIISLMVFVLLTMFDFGGSGPDTEDIPYSTFKQRLRDDEIVSVQIRGDRISGNYRNQGSQPSQFVTTFPPMEDADLFPLLEEYDVEVRDLLAPAVAYSVSPSPRRGLSRAKTSR